MHCSDKSKALPIILVISDALPLRHPKIIICMKQVVVNVDQVLSKNQCVTKFKKDIMTMNNLAEIQTWSWAEIDHCQAIQHLSYDEGIKPREGVIIDHDVIVIFPLDILNNGHRYKIIANGHLWCYNHITTVVKLSIKRAFDNHAFPWIKPSFNIDQFTHS